MPSLGVSWCASTSLLPHLQHVLMVQPPNCPHTVKICRCDHKISTHCVCFLVQVNPPDSPEAESPLQGSLHSEGSSGSSTGNTHDDFVMIDFVSALISALTQLHPQVGFMCWCNGKWFKSCFHWGEKIHDCLLQNRACQSQNCNNTDTEYHQLPMT